MTGVNCCRNIVLWCIVMYASMGYIVYLGRCNGSHEPTYRRDGDRINAAFVFTSHTYSTTATTYNHVIYIHVRTLTYAPTYDTEGISRTGGRRDISDLDTSGSIVAYPWKRGYKDGQPVCLNEKQAGRHCRF
ncbi:hypothetical protein F5B22DRAFT_495277 [Xylaria bambusicola]|uniref:uncharacterized protein n=1 Tax=Xylaria bambusicola TaxID=326684 RepID=UPI002007AC93|nr:uncharacterized protein F5B22DRAFT_495277 [Xylaria bambusicola]KAI0505737.1 hypothetical protein F5B22DRAFT_495277 [Xylaria bambusicola]